MPKSLMVLMCLCMLGPVASAVGTTHVDIAEQQFAKAAITASTSDTLSKEKRLDYSYQMLVDSYNKYLNNVFQTLGLVGIAIGWLIGSNDSRTFLKQHKPALHTFLVVICVMWLIHILALIDNYVEGTKIMANIQQLNYVDADFFDRYRPKPYKTIGSAILDTALFVLLFTIVYRLKEPNT